MANKFVTITITSSDLIAISPTKFKVRKTAIVELTEDVEIADQLMTQITLDASVVTLFKKGSVITDFKLSEWSSVDDAFSEEEGNNEIQWSINNNVHYTPVNEYNTFFGGIASGTGEIVFIFSTERIPLPYYVIAPLVPQSYPGYTVAGHLLMISTIGAFIANGSELVYELDFIIENMGETDYVDNSSNWTNLGSDMESLQSQVF